MDTATAVVEAPAPSPWLTMWLSPRVTIRRILDSEVRPSWTMVVALATMGTAIAALQVDETGALSASRSMMPVLIGTLQVIFGVIVGPFILAIVGGWLGGEADASDLREAVAWSYVPVAATTPLWIPIVLTLGTATFASDLGEVNGVGWLGVLLLTIVGLGAIWTVPLTIGGIAAAQRFSIGKTILCIGIPLIPLVMLRLIGIAVI